MIIVGNNNVTHVHCMCICIDVMAKDFERAKELLLGAVDTVLKMADHISSQASSPASSPASSLLGASCSGGDSHSSVLGATASSSGFRSAGLGASNTAGKNGGAPRTGLEEHRRLFSFAPSKSSRRYKGKTPKAKRPKRGPATWRKECVCLRSSTARLPPSTVERMQLASMGLGLRELMFESDGGKANIDEVIFDAYPKLIVIGSYKLMRLSDVGRVLVNITVPEGGMTVPYLKDIVRQARLYVSPTKNIVDKVIIIHNCMYVHVCIM